jgi:hypothetical protein
MRKITDPRSLRELFSEIKFPYLYSKRGFEKGRIKFIIPQDRTNFAYIKCKNGDHLSIEI